MISLTRILLGTVMRKYHQWSFFEEISSPSRPDGFVVEAGAGEEGGKKRKRETIFVSLSDYPFHKIQIKFH